MFIIIWDKCFFTQKNLFFTQKKLFSSRVTFSHTKLENTQKRTKNTFFHTKNWQKRTTSKSHKKKLFCTQNSLFFTQISSRNYLTKTFFHTLFLTQNSLFFTQMYVLTESLFFGILQYFRTQSNLYCKIACLGMLFNGPKTRNRLENYIYRNNLALI